MRFFSKCEVIKQEEITSKPIGLLAPEAMNLIPSAARFTGSVLLFVFFPGAHAPGFMLLPVSRASVFATVDDVEI